MAVNLSKEATDSIREPEKQIPVIERTDVLVCGGGPAGLGAAFAAAKTGARVVLVEQNGCLGGLATQGLVTSFMSMSAFSGKRQLIKGVWDELVNRMVAQGGAIKGPDIEKEKPGWAEGRHEPDTDITTFDPECFKRVAEQMALEYGITLYYHTYICEALMEGLCIRGVILENKNGRNAILAHRVIDCTGDGDIAARAGAEFALGRPEDKLCMPLTTMFVVGGIKSTVKTLKWEPRLEYGAINLFPLPRDGVYRAEMTRAIGRSGIDARDLTKAEIECREQIPRVIQFLRDHHPGAEEAYLIEAAYTVGVQDTRRIVGLYELTEDDIINYRVPEDTIAMNGYGVDIHNPTGSGCSLCWLIPGHGYGIPYRCLVPLHIENLLVAGRCISANVSAQSSIRIMAACMATGEAAGTASALSVQKHVSPRELDISELQEKLRSQNVYLGESEPPLPEPRFIRVEPDR